MSHKVIEELCIGCGGCEYACSTGALTKTDSFLGLFTIDPFTCNDCADCVPKCPESAIVVDSEWATCLGHGCPLASRRLEGLDCAYWLLRCPDCGATMWRERRPGESDDRRQAGLDAVAHADGWVCARCDRGMKVACPRTRKQAAAGHGEGVPAPVAH